MEIHTRTDIEADLNLQLVYTGSKLLYHDQEQWILVNFDDFQESTQGWSDSKVSVCGFNDNVFLGGHCNFGAGEVSKTFTKLPPHNMIKVTANYHFLDKWEGEEGFMKVDGIPVWSDTYQWCDKVMQWYCKKYTINACGAEFPDRLAVPINFESKLF